MSKTIECHIKITKENAHVKLNATTVGDLLSLIMILVAECEENTKLTAKTILKNAIQIFELGDAVGMTSKQNAIDACIMAFEEQTVERN